MAVYPRGTYRPLNQFSDRMVKPRLGVVLHVNDSNGPSLFGWIAGNNGMSCHFQIAKSGHVEQYVDTDNAAWCQMAGNAQYLSIETEGFPIEPLTPAQVAACADLMRWLHNRHGIALVVSNKVGDPGFAWHGMGGAAWGGHTGCPGDKRKAQRAEILRIARQGATPPPSTEDDDMYLVTDTDSDSELTLLVAGPEVFVLGPDDAADYQALGVPHKRISPERYTHLRARHMDLPGR